MSNLMKLALVPLLAALPAVCQLPYPHTRTVDVAENLHGTTYKDPFRWLEKLEDKEVAAWFKTQGEMADGVLEKIPGREALVKEWLALDGQLPTTYSSVSCVQNRYFYEKTLSGQNAGKLYLRKGWQGKESLLFDPGAYQAGVATTINAFTPSPDGHFVVLALSSGGSGFYELRVLDVDRRVLLPEQIRSSFGATGWAQGGGAFFYDAGTVEDLQNPDVWLNRTTRLHRLGSAPASDPTVFSRQSHPQIGLDSADIPLARQNLASGMMLGMAMTVDMQMKLFFAPKPAKGLGSVQWKPLCQRSDKIIGAGAFDREEDFGVAFRGKYIYAVSAAGAPRRRIIRTLLEQPDWARAETVLPEATDVVESITRTPDFLMVVYSDGIRSRLVRYAFATEKTETMQLPATGKLSISCPNPRSNRCLVALSTWTAPVALYDLEPGKGRFTRSALVTEQPRPAFSDLVAEELEVPSHDGTLIPLSIIRAKSKPLDGSQSCILEGYGAYGISRYPPEFHAYNAIARHGVVVAYAHVRGGGEKGEAWHLGGYKNTKPNSWKDFIACADYLVKKGYTSPQRLGCTGRSAGGMLISRAITERPELFRAAICNVGAANAMRMEFDKTGEANLPEFGSIKDPADCLALYEMDGFQHVQNGVAYPAVLGVIGLNDANLAPWETGKFIAALQQASNPSRPALLKVNSDSGHHTDGKAITFKDLAGQYAFILWQTGHKDFQPVGQDVGATPQ
jgi:prolyl oligopeptidase